jgi:hypothetical protein
MKTYHAVGAILLVIALLAIAGACMNKGSSTYYHVPGSSYSKPYKYKAPSYRR